MSVAAVVGGQFGSEGKGLIAGHIAKDYGHHVRVGAANAGHTLYTPLDAYPVRIVDEGDHTKDEPLGPTHEKHVMQQIPCAAYANPHASLYVGPGALISNEIFQDELTRLFQWRRDRDLPLPYVFVDARAHVITDDHVERESQSDLAERIGSTSTLAREGIGAAQAARVMRESDCVTAETFYGAESALDVECPHYISDIPAQLARVDGILLEGTQGTGLSLTTGRFPYVTSRNTTVAGLCADAGVAPTRLDRVILVCRTFPIRVAGNSGPFWGDSSEMSWAMLGIDPDKELTTVTKKIRRVASFSMDQLEEAITLNGPTEIALTFCDYVEPTIAGVSGRSYVKHLPRNVQDFVRAIEELLVPVRYLGTGPHSVIEVIQ